MEPVWQTDPILAAMITAARAGGAEIKRHFRQALTIQTKSRASDVVTQADLGSEREVLAVLHGAFPTAGIKSEETGSRDSTAHDEWFIIDPLDGTHNFSLGIPLCAVSIARMQPFGTVTHGVIYEPIVEATYAAALGGGAWQIETGRQLQVNPEMDSRQSTLHYACGYAFVTDGWQKTQQTIAALRDISERVMINWTPATDATLVARGATVGLYSDHNELHDVAAGIILVREAGGVVVNFSNHTAADTDRELVLAANPQIAAAILQAAGKARS